MQSLSEQLWLWKGCFHNWQDPFSEPEGATIRARYVGLCRQSTPSPVHFTFLLQSKVLPVRKIFLLIFVLFHFSCKWIAAVVLWDCSHPPTPPPPTPHRLFSIVCNNKTLESIHLLITEPERSHERLLCYIFCLWKEKSLWRHFVSAAMSGPQIACCLWDTSVSGRRVSNTVWHCFSCNQLLHMYYVVILYWLQWPQQPT